MSDDKAFATVVVSFLIFLSIILGGTVIGDYYGDKEKTEQMRECVAAGKDWVRDGYTSYYECK
jgi:hypothetical protein